MAKLTANGYRPVKRFTTADGSRRYIVTVAPDGTRARLLRQLHIAGRWETPTRLVTAATEGAGRRELEGWARMAVSWGDGPGTEEAL